ncbi:MAG: twin-arginine translocation signal domain-containing protein, partial [Planctomycetota bacterium]
MAENLNRRSFLKKSMIATGAAGFMSFEEKALFEHQAMAA